MQNYQVNYKILIIFISQFDNKLIMMWVSDYKGFQKFSNNDNFLKNVEILIIIVPFIKKINF